MNVKKNSVSVTSLNKQLLANTSATYKVTMCNYLAEIMYINDAEVYCTVKRPLTFYYIYFGLFKQIILSIHANRL